MYELSQRPCHVAYGAEKSCQMMSMSGMMISATLTQSHNWKVVKKCFQMMPISYLMSHVHLQLHSWKVLKIPHPSFTSLVTASRIGEILWRAPYCWTMVEKSVLSVLCNTTCVTHSSHFFARAKRRWGRRRYLMKACIWVRPCYLPDSKV